MAVVLAHTGFVALDGLLSRAAVRNSFLTPAIYCSASRTLPWRWPTWVPVGTAGGRHSLGRITYIAMPQKPCTNLLRPRIDVTV